MDYYFRYVPSERFVVKALAEMDNNVNWCKRVAFSEQIKISGLVKSKKVGIRGRDVERYNF